MLEIENFYSCARAEPTRKRKQDLLDLGTARDHVRLLSQDGPTASAWLSVIPSRAANTLLSDSDFRLLCRHWLGLPVLPDGTVVRCPLCGGSVDPFGDHFLCCRKNGITQRHNALRDAWSYQLTSAAVSHKREVASGNDQHRPADILLLNWDRGADIAVDFTISSPMSLDNFPLTIEGGKRHLISAEDKKIAKEHLHKTCTHMRWGLQPATFSPWGGAPAPGRSLLSTRLSNGFPVTRSEAHPKHGLGNSVRPFHWL